MCGLEILRAWLGWSISLETRLLRRLGFEIFVEALLPARLPSDQEFLGPEGKKASVSFQCLP